MDEHDDEPELPHSLVHLRNEERQTEYWRLNEVELQLQLPGFTDAVGVFMETLDSLGAECMGVEVGFSQPPGEWSPFGPIARVMFDVALPRYSE